MNGKVVPRTERYITAAFIGITLIAAGFFVRHVWKLMASGPGGGTVRFVLELSGFALIILFLIYGALVYQFARYGYFKRLENAAVPGKDSYDALVRLRRPPSVTFLVPSYKEDYRTILQTLYSAALQRYPRKRIVLLLDDPSVPASDRDATLQKGAFRAVSEIRDAVREQKAALFLAYRRFLERRTAAVSCLRETALLARLIMRTGQWFRNAYRSAPENDHTDALFRKIVLREPARWYLRRARKLQRMAKRGRSLSLGQLTAEYRKLRLLYTFELSVFQRKRYENLSHAPNKAMNINSYIGLMGGHWREERVGDSLRLVRSDDRAPGTFFVPDSDYVVTLDADSLLRPEYSATLVGHLERPENARTAVAQTPYSAVPGPAGVIERIAGATTDIQYIIHQGFTHFGATYWVGANAVLRKRALDDIRVTAEERGHPIVKFIQDRTVIEDTESTIDLVEKGWTLHNHPERLAYSASPTDFGSLVIQRKRWANGGLLIAPKLVRHLASHLKRPGYALVSGFFRLHYLLSITFVNLGVLALLFYPFRDDFLSAWVVLSGGTYYLLYWRDLLRLGYRKGDLLRVYALNLMLIPINLAGVAASIRQALTRTHTAFARTPKIGGRTAAPRAYLLAETGLLAFSLFGVTMSLWQGHFLRASFVLINALFFAYVLRMIGFRQAFADLFRIPRRAIAARRQGAEQGQVSVAALPASLADDSAGGCANPACPKWLPGGYLALPAHAGCLCAAGAAVGVARA